MHDRSASDGAIEREISLQDMLSPDQLWQRYTAWKGIESPQNPVVNQDYFDDGSGKSPRYYQTRAVMGNFRLQKAVFFARRKMREHVKEMAHLKKAAGPYNPSMKYSGGIAIAKQKNRLREARGRFGFGHVTGPDAGDAAESIGKHGYGDRARWVAGHFRLRKNEDWERLATVDYAMEQERLEGKEPDAAQILHYIASDPEWRPKIEKFGLDEMSVGTAMAEVSALFGGGA